MQEYQAMKHRTCAEFSQTTSRWSTDKKAKHYDKFGNLTPIDQFFWKPQLNGDAFEHNGVAMNGVRGTLQFFNKTPDPETRFCSAGVTLSKRFWPPR